MKRPLTPPLPDIPEKKIKGILKHHIQKGSNIIESNELPTDFFDNSKLTESNQEEHVGDKNDLKDAETLPEGFFDDPKLDAKVSIICKFLFTKQFISI